MKAKTLFKLASRFLLLIFLAQGINAQTCPPVDEVWVETNPSDDPKIDWDPVSTAIGYHVEIFHDDVSVHQELTIADELTVDNGMIFPPDPESEVLIVVTTDCDYAMSVGVELFVMQAEIVYGACNRNRRGMDKEKDFQLGYDQKYETKQKYDPSCVCNEFYKVANGDNADCSTTQVFHQRSQTFVVVPDPSCLEDCISNPPSVGGDTFEKTDGALIGESNVSLLAYPNPSSGEIQLEYAGSDIERIEVYNLQSQRIMEVRPNKTADDNVRLQLKITIPKSGLYIIRAIGANGKIATQKVMVND